jgi:hypothetical protein
MYSSGTLVLTFAYLFRRRPIRYVAGLKIRPQLDHPIVSGRRAPLGNDDWFEALLVFYVLPLVQTDISEVILRKKLHLGEV